VLAHRLGRAETGVAGHLVDGVVGGLQQVPGPFHALLGEPLTRADAGLLAEAAREGAD
jgi:hypothetical protein